MEQRPGTQFLERSLWRDGQVKCKLQTANCTRQARTHVPCGIRIYPLSPVPCSPAVTLRGYTVHLASQNPTLKHHALSLSPHQPQICSGASGATVSARLFRTVRLLSVNIGPFTRTCQTRVILSRIQIYDSSQVLH